MVSVYLRDELLDEIREAAREKGMTTGGTVAWIVEEWYTRQKEGKQ